MPIDKRWEDKFDADSFDDYKSAHVEHEALRQQNSNLGWIYIGVHKGRNDIAKIGMTAGALGTRASGTQNPFFALLCAFKVKEGVAPNVIEKIEDETIQVLESIFERIRHESSGRLSEWFYAEPAIFRKIVHDFLCENFSSHMYCYWCSERDICVIYSWENSGLLGRGATSPYGPDDLSNPPIAFECLMPPGCGADCQCW